MNEINWKDKAGKAEARVTELESELERAKAALEKIKIASLDKEKRIHIYRYALEGLGEDRTADEIIASLAQGK